ncbi:MAG: hypothetical protein U0787_10895 [Polyangia bacterium]
MGARRADGVLDVHARQLLLSVGILLLDQHFGISKIAGVKLFPSRVYLFVTFLPSLCVSASAVCATRNFIGWYVMVPIVSLVFLLQAGERKDNEYGPAVSRSDDW